MTKESSTRTAHRPNIARRKKGNSAVAGEHDEEEGGRE
jgi:hypothetical protein